MLTMLIALQAEILRGSSSHAPPAADSVMPMAPPAADSLVPIAPPADDSDGHIAGPAADSDDEVASSAADSDDEIDPPAADSDDEIAPPAADSDEDIHSPAADSWDETASPAADSDDDIAPPPPASEVSLTQDTHRSDTLYSPAGSSPRSVASQRSVLAVPIEDVPGSPKRRRTRRQMMSPASSSPCMKVNEFDVEVVCASLEIQFSPEARVLKLS